MMMCATELNIYLVPNDRNLFRIPVTRRGGRGRHSISVARGTRSSQKGKSYRWIIPMIAEHHVLIRQNDRNSSGVARSQIIMLPLD